MCGGQFRSRATTPTRAIRPAEFASTTFVFGDHDIEAPDLRIVESDCEEAHGGAPRRKGRGLICACSAGDEHDVLMRSTLRGVTFWFGRQSGLHAYQDIVRAGSRDRVSYFGRRRWPAVGSTIGMAGVGKGQAWAADKQLAERMCDIDGEPDGGRFVALSAEAIAAWLEASDITWA